VWCSSRAYQVRTKQGLVDLTTWIESNTLETKITAELHGIGLEIQDQMKIKPCNFLCFLASG